MGTGQAFVRRCFSLFIPFSKDTDPLPLSVLSREGSVLVHPRPPPKHYQRPLIVTLFICAHSEAAKQGDKWALPCASACVGGVRLFMELGGYVFSLLPSPARLHRHKKPEQQVLCGKVSSCPLGAERGNLL